MFHAQELGSYAQGQGSLAEFKVTARDQGHYKGPSGAFVTNCNISCIVNYGLWASVLQFGLCVCQSPHTIMKRKKKHVQGLSCTCTAAKILN